MAGEKFRFGVVGTARLLTVSPVNDIINANQAGLIYPTRYNAAQTIPLKVKQFNANAPVQVTVMDLTGKVVKQYNTGKGIIELPAASRGRYVPARKLINGTNSYI